MKRVDVSLLLIEGMMLFQVGWPLSISSGLNNSLLVTTRTSGQLEFLPSAVSASGLETSPWYQVKCLNVNPKRWLPLYSLRHALPFTFNSVDHSVHRGKEKNHEHRISIENYQYKSYLPWRKFVTKWHPSLLDVESKQIHSAISKKQTLTIVLLKTDDFEESNAEN